MIVQVGSFVCSAAVKSSVAFTEQFFSRIGLKPIHGGWLIEMAVDYASLQPLEKMGAKRATGAKHIVEHPIEPRPEIDG